METIKYKILLLLSILVFFVGLSIDTQFYTVPIGAYNPALPGAHFVDNELGVVFISPYKFQSGLTIFLASSLALFSVIGIRARQE